MVVISMGFSSQFKRGVADKKGITGKEGCQAKKGKGKRTDELNFNPSIPSSKYLRIHPVDLPPIVVPYSE